LIPPPITPRSYSRVMRATLSGHYVAAAARLREFVFDVQERHRH
jgi:hypothetical protein